MLRRELLNKEISLLVLPFILLITTSIALGIALINIKNESKRLVGNEETLIQEVIQIEKKIERKLNELQEVQENLEKLIEENKEQGREGIEQLEQLEKVIKRQAE